ARGGNGRSDSTKGTRGGNGQTARARTSAGASRSSESRAGAQTNGLGSLDEAALQELLAALRAARDGNFSVRLPGRRSSLIGQIGAAFNDLVDMNARMTKELTRV